MKDGKGFSWEWFKRTSGNEFDKLQGPGRVRARFINKNGLAILGSVEVLEAITLRINTMQWLPMWDGDTHHVVVEPGSVMLFAE